MEDNLYFELMELYKAERLRNDELVRMLLAKPSNMSALTSEDIELLNSKYSGSNMAHDSGYRQQGLQQEMVRTSPKHWPQIQRELEFSHRKPKADNYTLEDLKEANE